jgi:hypothetical protein
MGRKRKKIVTTMVNTHTVSTIEDDTPDECVMSAEIKIEPVYSFPSRSRCPRCHSINTIADGKHNDTQYRVCQQPICRKRYSVKGVLV